MSSIFTTTSFPSIVLLHHLILLDFLFSSFYLRTKVSRMISKCCITHLQNTKKCHQSIPACTCIRIINRYLPSGEITKANEKPWMTIEKKYKIKYISYHTATHPTSKSHQQTKELMIANMCDILVQIWICSSSLEKYKKGLCHTSPHTIVHLRYSCSLHCVRIHFSNV